MISTFENLLLSYKSKGLLIDSNLLLLLIIGYINLDFIEKFKRTKAYTAKDHKVLNSLVTQFNTLLTTPNVLTEVSNLANSLGGNYRIEFEKKYSRLIKQLIEHYVESAKITAEESLLRFGLTDAGIYEVCRGNYLILTDDFKLTSHLNGLGVDVINFNHIRDSCIF